MSLLQLYSLLSGSSIVITISGDLGSHLVSNGSTARSGYRVNADGTIDERQGTSFFQVDSATDWRVPNGSGSGFHVRFSTILLSSDPDVGTLDTWLEITSDREFYYQETTDDTESSGTILIEISDDGGSTVLDSGNYSCAATVGIPP
jgi:hypothetical protein